ncbi:hypothetical protein V1478_015534 [Vespula squamosa]|uniref:Uncharacterized protein n=1 Tax=Vespula squamosa TaxID=30214 RepID=A0ABD2A643_VESSQ
MPCFFSNTWIKYHYIISEDFCDTAYNLKDLKLRSRRYCITIVVDKSWTKNSYRNQYNSLLDLIDPL